MTLTLAFKNNFKDMITKIKQIRAFNSRFKFSNSASNVCNMTYTKQKDPRKYLVNTY